VTSPRSPSRCSRSAVPASRVNDDFNVPALHGTCTTCHDAPNAGDHSLPVPHGRPAALHAATQQAAIRNALRYRSGPGAPHRKMERHRKVQGTDPACARRACTVFSQRLGTRARRRGRSLRHALQDWAERTTSATSSRSCARCRGISANYDGDSGSMIQRFASSIASFGKTRSG
jgi:hypothetical protein